MRMIPSIALMVGGLLVAPAHAGGRYIDARHYPSNAAGHMRFVAVERALERGFDDICGDTFCEGQYYNLWAMRLRCSVHSGSGVLAGCIWTFAGSDTRVRGDGRFDVDQGAIACALPIAAGTRLEDVLRAWEAAPAREAIHVPVPGMPGSVYEALTDCL
ncbi:hypothetical protein [Stenotrophomonas sp. YAU14D1_LEIMI4_1]|uniref:hypothetical protein n=1 Tax=Stenotrophomonas sp. YAU14D1_LEIMI4_1 TaxID=2072407 RepID=UPI000D53FC5A|nr:hypothetical protein [Stenotrophomonas sp. YAU14D1_LEIMI4_1]AWH26493.1 hypothetical protein C1932_16025 [Stenotrophomonas sp. YAU14D1_LEIMI4_1]